MDQKVTKPGYSQKLHDLIRVCVEITQEGHPSAAGLVQFTREGLDSCTRAAQDMSEQDREQLRLLYRGRDQ